MRGIPTIWPQLRDRRCRRSVDRLFGEEDQFDRRSLWRLGSWGAGASALSSCGAGPSVLDRITARADRQRRSGAGDRSKSQVDRQESQHETRRLASVIDTLERRSRPAVLAHHRPGTGIGFDDRLNHTQKCCREFAAGSLPSLPRQCLPRQCHPDVARLSGAPSTTTSASPPSRAPSAAAALQRQRL